MSILYLLAMAAVFAAVVAITWSAVAAVSRKPIWEQAPARSSRLELLVSEDRRVQSLAYVGADRRTPTATPQVGEEALREAA